FAAAIVALQHPQVGGLQGLLTHPNVVPKLSMIPPLDWSTTESRDFLLGFLVVPLAVQWWSVWYPGAEPGGGGYLVQRMLAARNEKEAVAATLFFNFAHYAIRPWPWIIVALASLIVFPDLESIQRAFPHVPADKIGNDVGYSAMLVFLPPGVMGLMLASLLAAYMSTIATHLNWGSSYVVNDVYKRFVDPQASERTLVNIGRVSTVVMMVLAAWLSLALTNAMQAFQIMLQIGAGTGLLFILRWFWWRINPWSELAAMLVSFVVSLVLQLGTFAVSWPEYQKIVVGVAITTVAWLLVTMVTPPSDDRVLREFVRLTNPGGPGWAPVFARAAQEGQPIRPLHDATNVPRGLLCTLLGTVAIYAGLFGSGMLLYEHIVSGVLTLLGGLVATALLFRVWQGIAGERRT
ncbi:MAG TPA: hypothetical protein VMF13_21080, partial [Luteitalea sp.]|nr:hypothetical protein [Luteitalea sp.]